MMTGFQAEENLTGRAPKNVQKILDVIEFLVTRNQGKHPDRGCAKASHDDRISGRGELDRASPQKMCEKFWTLSLFVPFRNTDMGMMLNRKTGTPFFLVRRKS